MELRNGKRSRRSLFRKIKKSTAALMAVVLCLTSLGIWSFASDKEPYLSLSEDNVLSVYLEHTDEEASEYDLIFDDASNLNLPQIKGWDAYEIPEEEVAKAEAEGKTDKLTQGGYSFSLEEGDFVNQEIDLEQVEEQDEKIIVTLQKDGEKIDSLTAKFEAPEPEEETLGTERQVAEDESGTDDMEETEIQDENTVSEKSDDSELTEDNEKEDSVDGKKEIVDVTDNSSEAENSGDDDEKSSESTVDSEEVYDDARDFMNDHETAGAQEGWDTSTLSSISADSGLWWIDDYYVGESDQYDVTKTDDFTLKYQVEFHSSEDLEAGAVEIIIDASLGIYRSGNNIIPTDIGIPYGTPPDGYTESSASPFNYYYIDGDGNVLTESQAKTAANVQIVVWNYRDIASGANAMFQVMYKSLDVMQIYDMTEWGLSVSASVDLTVDGKPTTETVNGNTLMGLVDTKATLSSVTKKAYTATGSSYTPELYTKSQVNSYISGSVPDPYASDFDSYIYIVWKVSLSGTATQAYEITIDENTFTDLTKNGYIVGFKNYSLSSGLSCSTTTGSSPSIIYSSSTARSFSATFYVVTAYDADTYVTDTQIENDVSVTVHPKDGYDADTTKSASDTTTWGEYEWNYSGDTIGIKKYVDTTGTKTSKTYSAYETLYELNASDGKDTGEFTFHTQSTDRGYKFTHNIDGSGMGEYIDGTYYTTTTVDDALYVYPNGGTTPSQMLTKDDYYFSSVKVSTTDNGYDVWEDTTAGAEASDDVDQDVYIYAMYYDEGDDADADGWEYVGKAEFSTSGTMTYTFSADDLERQPYRVKAVHSTINYATYCTITLGVTLRGDSPTIAGILEEYGDDLTSLEIENLSGVAGQAYGQDARKEDVYVNGVEYHDGDYFQDTSVSGSNYSEKDTVTGETLETFTQNLYGTILMRDNSYSTLTQLEETASASKNVSTQNDPANARVLADYTLTAYEAYYVTGSSTVDYLKDAGIYLPKRNEVSYYDLLPYGMQFNANADVTAGRISSMNSSGTWKTNSGAWDKTGVSVTVDESDVITNWNDTGRTMVIFHIKYDGDDASAFYDVPSSNQDLWFEGFGVAFQAYYDWADMDVVDAEYNIAAYIAENVTDETEQFLGVHDQNVFKDDGTANVADQYEPFMVSDLNGDETTGFYTNMYCSTSTTTGVATASQDSIKKLVRADDDTVAEYGTTAAVGNGKGYTYDVSLTNGTGATLSDIVIFDRLEHSVEDERYLEETSDESVFTGISDDDRDNHWTGTFNGLTLTALDDLGINYTVYYNTNRDATISGEDGTPAPADVLTAANGWYKESEYTGSISDVKAIAVDLGDFTMDQETSLSFQIHMTAPNGSNYTYAFNNPSYYTVSTDMTGDVTKATDIGDTVRVELGDAGTLSVEKEFADGYAVPDAMANMKFTFTITRGDSILANQEYMLYTWDEDTNDWIATGVVSATDIKGQFTLKAGQKAVFSDLVDVENVAVTETETPLWEIVSDKRTDTSSTEASYLFENKYRSPVYLYKTTATTDLATDEELENTEFTFKIEVDTNGDGTYDSLYANGTVLYVDEALTDGSSPTVLGTATANSNGEITLKIGDIIAFFPTDADGNTIGVSYKITETSTGESWFCENDSVTGTTTEYGKTATITNYYKYRQLIITKDLSDYDHDIDECECEWTFKVTDSDGKAVVGNYWYMIDSDGNPTGIDGTLDSNGCLAFTGAGSNCQIVIDGLVANEKYTITETNYDEDLFEPVNDGTLTTTMPSYSVTKKGTITNKYLLKDLRVQKIALSKDTDADVSKVEFTFTLKDGDGNAVANAEYTIENGDGTMYTTDSSGKFTLNGGETAVFDDIGYIDDVFVVTETANSTYPQIYPTDNADGTATLTNGGGDILFINGNFENVVSFTKTLAGLDEYGEAFADAVMADNTTEITGDGAYGITVEFGIYDANGNLVTSDTGKLGDYSGSGYVYILIGQDGSYELKSYNGGLMQMTLSPYDMVYIAEIGDYSVKISEVDAAEIISVDKTKVGVDQVIIEEEIVGGSLSSGDTLSLVNNVSSANNASSIYKLMTDASDEVPTGSSITFRVERYDAKSDSWSPASGIKYILLDGYEGDKDIDANAVSGILATDSTGQITVTKTDDGYPYIRFTEDEVYTNVYTGDIEDGTLRILEISADDAWGVLAGYDGEGWVNGPALDVIYGDTFYNANDSELEFEVEKQFDDESTDDDTLFTYYLVHVTSAQTSPITTLDEVNDSEIGSGVYYIVYDKETGVKLSDGYTGEDGSFQISAGQYAKFFVPEGTVWYVYEAVSTGYTLINVETNGADNADVIDDVIGIVQDTTNAYATGTIILTLTDSDTGEPLAGGTFDLYKDGTKIQSGLVTDENGQVTVTELTGGEYYFNETEAADGYKLPDNTQTDTVTIPGNLARPETYEIGIVNEENVVAVNYAVKLWGIYTDEYSDDEGGSTGTASLTFGPALGADHLDSHVECSSDTCIHKLSWDEIIALCDANRGNETALTALFGSCLENGCTKAVPLNPNDDLFDMDVVDNMLEQNYSGDGVDCLYYLIGYNNSSTKRNLYWTLSYTGYSADDPANIYSRSKVRTTLNGDDTNIQTQLDAGGNNYYYDDDYPLFDESNCLLSCFPQNLQDAIAPRVIDNTGNPSSGSYKGYDTTTTYDKLWLPSLKEVGISNNYDDGAGSDYGIASGNSDRIAYEFSNANATASSARSWWSRSRDSYTTNSACVVNTSGSSYYDSVSGDHALAPGFSLY